MFQEKTDREWEKWGAQNPYYGVLTDKKFLKENINAAALEDFFNSGESDITEVFQIIRSTIAPEFAPGNTLDFGCGVGRLVVPLSFRSGKVTGVDISASMLKEAKQNCARKGISNVALLHTDAFIKQSDSFDFIHSYIVFQHMQTPQGVALFQHLLSRLSKNGVGAIHLTYAHRNEVPDTPLRKVIRFLKPLIPYRHLIERVLKGLPLKTPGMQMNCYDLNRIFKILQAQGINNCHVKFTDHGGPLGVFLYFKKESST